MTPRQHKENAERLLSDPTLQKAFNMIKDDAVGVFIYPNASQEDIDEARRMVLALAQIETKLKKLITDFDFVERRK